MVSFTNYLIRAYYFETPIFTLIQWNLLRLKLKWEVLDETMKYVHSEYPWSIELESDSLLGPSFF